MAGFIPLLTTSGLAGGGGGGPALAVSLNTTIASKSGLLSTLTTNVVTGTPSGGTAPYTYSWAVTTSDGIFAVSPTASSTAFRKLDADEDQDYVGTAKLTVTDAAADVVVSATVSITISRGSFIDGGGTA